MSRFDHTQYRPFVPPVTLPDRRWPEQRITQAPRWCAVDLRDGNQALVEPMTVEQKRRLFMLLLEVGFQEIEVGFPAASQPDFAFVRWIIEQGVIPDGVAIQALTQARKPLIERTFEALHGVPRAIVHLYNSTSKVQREQVFVRSRAEVIALAVAGAEEVRAQAEKYPDTEWTFQYSPESFSATEPEFAVAICEAVMAVWQPTPKRPMIINLPATVEMATPNVYADQVEWFCRTIARREALVISLHTHNDRGTAIAAAELGLMAGADRIEGTLLGNGERTGNMDILTLAMNLYSQGIDPRLDLSDMARIVRTVEEVTAIPLHPRHPWAGELVYTAFSGSHQDAIRKCLAARRPEEPWEVAYLPINPEDIGRSYQEVIRINSQSGKGGVSYLLERDHGLMLPRWMQIEFAQVVQRWAERGAVEVTSDRIWQLFQEHYIEGAGAYRILRYQIDRNSQAADQLVVELQRDQEVITLCGSGQGVLEALVKGIEQDLGVRVEITNYHEQAMQGATDADAVAYLQLRCAGHLYSGVALHRDSVSAMLEALLVAFSRIGGEVELRHAS